jgi:hypothetical protein
MSLKNFIADGLEARAFRLRPMPKRSRASEVFDQVAARRNKIASLPQIDLDALEAKVRDIAQTGRWDELDARQLWHVPACLWSGKTPLASEINVVRGYLEVLREQRSRIATKALIFHFLLRFEPDAANFEMIGLHLAREVGRWRWEWGQRHDRFSLFDAKRGPRTVGQQALESHGPRSVLDDAGLHTSLSASGFALACFREAAAEVQERLQRSPSTELVRRLVEFVAGPDGRMSNPRAARYLANALLTPWLSTDPSDELRDHIRGALLNFLNDPRVRPAEWNGVDQHAKRVMFRWLARASLEQFLAVVDQTAPGQQWEFRRAFWGGYIDRNYVHDSWVVFAPMGAARARQLARERDDAGMLTFGALRGAAADQAVLLLRVGDLIIADWSHNGSLRIWHDNDPGAPKIDQHETEYYGPALRTNCAFSKWHVGSWQQDAEAFIRTHTGIRLMSVDYLPTRRRL